MFLKKDPRPNGRLYLSIVKSYRDPKTKMNKQKAVLSVGFMDKLQELYDDSWAMLSWYWSVKSISVLIVLSMKNSFF